MRHEKFPAQPIWRFPLATISPIADYLRTAGQMTQNSSLIDSENSSSVGPHAKDYFWRPWYAKIWWASIPIYWLLMSDPTRPSFLNEFATGPYAAYLAVFFLPITTILILGFGYFSRLLQTNAAGEYARQYDQGGNRGAGLPHPTMDEFDPASGPLWMGNRHRDDFLS